MTEEQVFAWPAGIDINVPGQEVEKPKVKLGPVINPRPKVQQPQVGHIQNMNSSLEAKPKVLEGPPNVEPTHVPALAEDEAVSLKLPSRFAYYGFKDIYVKPLRSRQLAKLSRAHEERSLVHLVEAVNSVLSTTSGPYVDLGYRLCTADFYFVLYWLKLNSFRKKQMRHTTYCTNPAHLEKVTEGSLAQDSLKIDMLVTDTMLQVTELETLPPPPVIDKPTWVFRPETMRDSVEFLELPDWNNPEVTYLARLASVIDIPKEDGSFCSLVEKCKPLRLCFLMRFLNSRLTTRRWIPLVSKNK